MYLVQKSSKVAGNDILYRYHRGSIPQNIWCGRCTHSFKLVPCVRFVPIWIFNGAFVLIRLPSTTIFMVKFTSFNTIFFHSLWFDHGSDGVPSIRNSSSSPTEGLMSETRWSHSRAIRLPPGWSAVRISTPCHPKTSIIIMLRRHVLLNREKDYLRASITSNANRGSYHHLHGKYSNIWMYVSSIYNCRSSKQWDFVYVSGM